MNNEHVKRMRSLNEVENKMVHVFNGASKNIQIHEG